MQDPHRPIGAGPAGVCAEARPGRRAAPREEGILRADALALSIKAALDRVSVALARAALGFVRESGWFLFGYARLDDCARERFGRCGVWVRQLAEIGAALEKTPALADVLTGQDGGRPLGTVAARMVARVATVESLPDWVAAARRLTVRELRREVERARRAGTAWPAGTKAVQPREDPQAADRRLVQIHVPASVAAAFDEALELFRAVAGHTASVADFVEALVADAMAGEHPPDADATLESVGQGSGGAREASELALARSTRRWAGLSGGGQASWALAMASESLGRFAQIAARAGEGDAVVLAGQIRDLIQVQDDLDKHLGRLLCDMGDMGAWSHLQFDGMEHYAEERLGIGRTFARQRVTASRRLIRYPLLRQAYERGEVGLEPALLILRILDGRPVDAATEGAWVEHARRSTVKRLRDERRALGMRGALERAGPDPLGVVPRLARPPGPSSSSMPPMPGVPPGPPLPPLPILPMSDAAWHHSLRREAGTTRERIRQLGRGLSADASLTAADVFLRLRLPADLAGDLLSAVESDRQRLSALVAEVAWTQPCQETRPPQWKEYAPDDAHSWSVLAARTFFVRRRRVPAWVGLLALLEEFVATWDVEDRDRRPKEREVYARAGYRCSAAGCTGRRSLECHHITYRSRAGGEELANKTCLCAWHHRRGEHGDLARFRGSAPLGVVCRLGREDVASWFRNEMRVEAPAAATPWAGP